MNKPVYADLLTEAENLAIERKRFPISVGINVTLIILSGLMSYLLSRYFASTLEMDKTVYLSLTVVFESILLILIIIFNFYLKIPITLSNSELSKCVDEVILQKENEYLEEVDDCSDHVTNLESAIPLAREELDIAKNNLVEFSAIKKALESFY